MANFQRILVAACAVALWPMASAEAGGTFRFPPEPVVAVPEAVPIAEYPTWYLRGDIGYAIHEEPDISQAGSVFVNEDLEDTFLFGGGLGYFFSDNIRGDVTVDYRDEAEVNVINSTLGVAQEYEVSSTVLLGNLYYDFNGRDRFSPYAGIGLGVTWNETGGGDYRTDLAAAAMAGISYRFSEDFLLDAGYRFLYLGKAHDDLVTSTAGVNIDEIMAHEFRVGVRYEFQ